MDVKIEKEGSKLTIKAAGKLDLDAANEYGPNIMEAIHDSEIKELVLDFAEIAYISSMGLRVILELHKKMEEKGGALKIKNISDEIRKSFNLVGFNRFLVLE